jgi:hypothetical protein
LRVTQTGAGNALVVEDSTNPDSTPFVVDASGNVIIGHTQNYGSPLGYQLQIHGASTGVGMSQWSASTGAPNLRLAKSRSTTIGTNSIVSNNDELGGIQFYGDDGAGFARGANIFAYVDGTPGAGDMPGRLVFSTTADGASSPTERMRITSGGDVGIGTTSPDAFSRGYGRILGVSSASSAAIEVNSATGNNAVIDLGVNGTRSMSITTDGSVPYINTIGALPLGFATNGSERARIDSSGNLLVGVSSGSRHILSKSNANTYGTVIDNTSGTNPYALGVQLTGVTGGAGIAFIECRDNAQRMLVAGNGNITNVNNSYGAISDAKLKENVTDATPKLDKLNQVRVVNYNLIGETQKQIGVIAQELEQIFPGMVEETQDRDADGNELGTTTKAVKYSVFVPMLIKAMQEQQATIESLTARIAALEAPAA